MKKTLSIIILFLATNCFSQSVSCNELLTFIKENGYQKSTLSNFILDSSWLYKVTAYEYEYKIYVVAEIKRNEYSYSTDTYIFCGIPTYNWSQFQYNYDTNSTYGKRFNEYIMDYRCNCK